jgi:hypothetical protein
MIILQAQAITAPDQTAATEQFPFAAITVKTVLMCVLTRGAINSLDLIEPPQN